MSGRWQLDKQDLVKLWKSLWIAVAGGVLVWITGLPKVNIDWGFWAPIIGPASTVVVNLLRKWLAKEGKLL